MENQQRIIEITGLAVAAIAKALESVGRLSLVDEPAVMRDFWPPIINVSTLAWIFSAETSTTTAICALAVGSRFPATASVEMQKGAALHKAVLPLAAEILQEQGIPATPERDFCIPELGVSGRVDLHISDMVVELKTTGANKREPSRYELVQSALYARLVAPCALVMVSIPRKAVFHARLISCAVAEDLSAGAMELLSQYHAKRNEVLNKADSLSSVPVLGNCMECPCRWVCEFRKRGGTNEYK